MCVGGESRSSGRDLLAALPHVIDCPIGFRSHNIHPSAVCVIAPTEIALRVIAVGVGVTEVDDVHFAIACFEPLGQQCVGTKLAMPEQFPLQLPQEQYHKHF